MLQPFGPVLFSHTTHYLSQSWYWKHVFPLASSPAPGKVQALPLDMEGVAPIEVPF